MQGWLLTGKILKYHPQMLKEYLNGTDANFMYPSAMDQFKRQFAHLEEHYGKSGSNTPLDRQHASSLTRPAMLYSSNGVHSYEHASPHSGKEGVLESREEAAKYARDFEKSERSSSIIKGGAAKPRKVVGPGVPIGNGVGKDPTDSRRPVSISSSTQQLFSSSVYYGKRMVYGKSDRDDRKIDSPNALDAFHAKEDPRGIGMATEGCSSSEWSQILGVRLYYSFAAGSFMADNRMIKENLWYS